MRRHYISSAVIRWFGYDPLTKTLDVEFVSGSRYRYSDVPEAVGAGLEAARSKGRYFDANIRDRYPTERLR
jgi:lysyl-tRNA synthetase class 2